MKRFYQRAAARPVAGGWEIALDDRPVRTPARAPLVVPSEGLGAAIAAEWEAQAEKIDARSMPLTGLANAAIDRFAPDPESFARDLAAYGESDLVCYRAKEPPALVERQAKTWDPLIAWARNRFDADFEIVTGVVHRQQPAATIERLRHAVAARSAFELAALSPLVTISGSLVIALALAERAVEIDAGWAAATLDEAFQAERWGEDRDAIAALAVRRGELEAAYRFLSLL